MGPVDVAVDSQGTVYVTSVLSSRGGISSKGCTSAGMCSNYYAFNDLHRPLLFHTAVAVDADDNLYMSASGTNDTELIRCPLGQDPCESLGDLDGDNAALSMAIDQDGVLYVVG